MTDKRTIPMSFQHLRIRFVGSHMFFASRSSHMFMEVLRTLTHIADKARALEKFHFHFWSRLRMHEHHQRLR